MKQLISLLWVILSLQLASQAQSLIKNNIDNSASPDDYEINCYQLKATSPVIHNIIPQVSVKAYPNPVTDILTIESSPGYALTRIIVYDINSGKKVKEKRAQNELETIDISELLLGIYSVVVYQQEKVTTIKIIKN